MDLFQLLFVGSFMLMTVQGTLYLYPGDNQYARMGSTTTLNCKASEDINSCSWETPNQTLYQFSTEFNTAESGRLEYKTVDAEGEKVCGLVVHNVTDEDTGTWFCHIGIITDNQVVSGKGQTSLNKASQPDSVTLVEPYDKGSVNVSYDVEGTKNIEPISCRVSNADPKPTFHWYIGDTKLSSDQFQTKDIKEDGEDEAWMQTLHYTPEVSHDNQMLRCVVEHVGLGDSDAREASVMLRLTARAKDYLNTEAIPEHDQAATTYAIAATVAVLVICIAFMVMYKKHWLCFKNNIREHTLQEEDEATSMKEMVKASEFTAVELNGGCTETDEKGNISRQNDSTPHVKEDKMPLTERFASFFRINKKDSMTEQANVELGLNNSKCSGNGVNGTLTTATDDKKLELSNNADKPDETDVKGDDNDKEECAEQPSAKESSRFKVSTVLKLFRKGGDQKNTKKKEGHSMDEEKGLQNGENEEDSKLQEEEVEEEEDQQVEFEPETKPTESETKSEETLEEEECQPKGSPKTTPV